MTLEDDSTALAAALRELPARAAHLLEHRFLEGKTDADVARFYGMTPEAYRVHLLRAARLFLEAATGESARAPSGREEEQAEADALCKSLSDPQFAPASVKLLTRELQRLEANAADVRARLLELAKADAESPAARRELWIRRVLIALLILVTAILYLTR